MSNCRRERFDWLVALRRWLHSNPETALEEHHTTRKIVTVLGDLNIKTHTFDDMTGVVGIIEGARPGPTIGLRADMDALPITELNNVDYKSVRDGVMHACGHDAHMAIMLGVAKKIHDEKLQSRMQGCVKLIFQPAEESGQGAREMISRGVLKNPPVARILAGHMSPDLPTGKVGVYKGCGYAACDTFTLTIQGRGGHGARPEETIDPIVAGAHFVAQVQTILGRNIAPSEAAVITVGKFRAGDATNVIPEFAVLAGTIRTLTPEVRQLIQMRMKDLAEGLERGFGVRCELQIDQGVPAVLNSLEVSEAIYEVCSSQLSADNVFYSPPTMASEDFAYFTSVCPGSIIRLGCSNGSKERTFPLHSPYFDIDEKVLEIAVDIFYEAVNRYLVVEG